MSGRILSSLLLLLIMMNHAVMACDALVIHLPEHDHVFTSLTDNHSNIEIDDTEHPTKHTHVTCHIAFFYGIELLNFSDSVIDSVSQNVNFISYSPPVPPPNA